VKKAIMFALKVGHAFTEPNIANSNVRWNKSPLRANALQHKRTVFVSTRYFDGPTAFLAITFREAPVEAGIYLALPCSAPVFAVFCAAPTHSLSRSDGSMCTNTSATFGFNVRIACLTCRAMS